MFLRLCCRAQRVCSGQNSLPQRAALLSTLFSFGLATACGAPAAHQNAGPTNGSLTLSASLPAAVEGTGYNASLTVTGGTAPYTFSVASGVLPTGLALADQTGMISGTPTQTGTYKFGIVVYDSKGLTVSSPSQIAVSSGSSNNPPPPTQTSAGKSFSNIQTSGGWGQYGQGPPNFVDCSPSPCDGISFSMAQNVASQFDLGGSIHYSDGLWNNHLIGPGSTQNMPDGSESVIPNLHDFTYDVYFYGDNLNLSQALEFDINQFFAGKGFIFGHECRIAGGNEWDVWDDANKKWVSTGVACYPNSNAWNHVTIKVHRTANDQLVYQSITLNGKTSNLNWAFNPGSTPNWYGVTINFQMDGNQNQDTYRVYLDNLTFTYQ